jgi:hypothetical protein
MEEMGKGGRMGKKENAIDVFIVSPLPTAGIVGIIIKNPNQIAAGLIWVYRSFVVIN